MSKVLRVVGMEATTATETINKMKNTLYHGTRNESIAPHIGLCLTPSERAAEHYATSRGDVYELDIDLSGLRVVEVVTGDRDAQDYAGDKDIASYDADVIVYADEDTHGYQHETYRIVSSVALARVEAALAY